MTARTRVGVTATIMLVLAAAVVPGATYRADLPQPGRTDFVLRVRPAVEEAVPGELLRVEISLANHSGNPLAVPAGAGVWEGNLSVQIARENGPFREYLGPGWGLRDVAAPPPITLQRGEIFQTEALILYNESIRTSHLNAAYAAEISTRRLPEGYALDRPGRYRIKAVLHLESGGTLESSTREVVIREPEGADSDVWSIIRTMPEIGYMMQAGSLKRASTFDAGEQLIAVMERLASDQPSSRYAEALRDGASKCRKMLDDLRARGLAMQ